MSEALNLGTKGRKNFLAVEIVRNLEQAGKVDKKWSELFSRLRQIRNSMAHGHDFSPDASFALGFVDAAEYLKRYLDRIGSAT